MIICCDCWGFKNACPVAYPVILREYGQHIKGELNVKEISYSSDEAGLVDILVKPNFPVLGPKFGKRMGELQKYLATLTLDQIAQIEEGGINLCARRGARSVLSDCSTNGQT